MRSRILIATALAFVLLAAPVATVNACSCAGLGGPVEIAAQVAANSTVAFVGTVVDIQSGGADPNLGMPTVRYAFAVERATVPVADVIEVRAVDDGGGASCGFTFGFNETWFVAADEQDGALHTGLCSGNVELETLADGERAGIAALLTVEPVPGAEAPDAGVEWLTLVGIGLVAMTVAGVTILAFRRDGVR